MITQEFQSLQMYFYPNFSNSNKFLTKHPRKNMNITFFPINWVELSNGFSRFWDRIWNIHIRLTWVENVF